MESMTLEQAYYIGELVVAVMVIISIFYLAIQVKQGNVSAQLDTVQKMNLGFNSVYESLSENGELADIYQRGIYDLNQLDRIEKMRFIVLLNRVIRIIWAMYYQRKTVGVMDEKIWNVFQGPFKDAFQMPGFQMYWEMKRHWFDKDFQDFVQITFVDAKDTKRLYPAPND